MCSYAFLSKCEHIDVYRWAHRHHHSKWMNVNSCNLHTHCTLHTPLRWHIAIVAHCVELHFRPLKIIMMNKNVCASLAQSNSINLLALPFCIIIYSNSFWFYMARRHARSAHQPAAHDISTYDANSLWWWGEHCTVAEHKAYTSHSHTKHSTNKPNPERHRTNTGSVSLSAYFPPCIRIHITHASATCDSKSLLKTQDAQTEAQAKSTITSS